MAGLTRYLPILDWGRSYDKAAFMDDGLAAIIVTIMLIPQSLAYAMLAGLPPEVGLYASILPLVAYALFGTSRALAVGPVAVVSLMTAAAVGQVAVPGSADYVGAAMLLAGLSGVFLAAMGFFRLGFLSNFLSHPVISGFITASGLIIATSQLKHLLGISASGHNLIEIVGALLENLGDTNGPTLIIGVAATAFLFWVRSGLQPLLLRFGLNARLAGMLTKTGPVVAVVVSILSVAAFGLAGQGVAIVGAIPTGLPGISLPPLDADLAGTLMLSAVLISVIGFVESVSVAQTLAAKRRQRIDPDQELIGLGASNIAASLSGGYPVTGGFARSVVNFDAGARTPAAGLLTAIGIALATLFLTPLLFLLPKAVLAATIIVAVLSLVDLGAVRRTFRYSKSDGVAMAGTILITLAAGVEIGVSAGVILSIAMHLYRTSRPHIAEVGLVGGTEHFRNIKRHHVETSDCLVTLRLDESLYFANARFLEDRVLNVIAERPGLKHLVLMCPAVNEIDSSGLESLEAINHRLEEAGVTFHLSEVKGPVMDRLEKSDFLTHLTGEVFLSQYAAIAKLDPPCAAAAR